MTEGAVGSGLALLNQIQRADVYKSHALAATLIRQPGGLVSFAYTRDWIENGGPAVATTLPVTSDPVITAAGSVPAFFAGLLPEGRRLGALRRGTKTSADDELTLLLGIGTDTVGDVQVVPEGQEPDRERAVAQGGSFSDLRFSQLLAELDIVVDRVGLPGVQDKLSAAMLSFPVRADGKDFILKLNPREFAHLVENESFFLAASRLTGIATVQSELVRDIDGEAGLAITRFDRSLTHGATARFAVEDGCQVMGLYPEAKYRVSTEEVLAALCRTCEAPLPAAAEFLSRIAFAAVTANGDAHAKNFAVMQDRSGRWQPSPSYDLPSSQPYGDTTMALTLGGSDTGAISGKRIVALGEFLGVRPRAAQSVVLRVADAVDLWIDGLGDLPFNQPTLHKLRRVVLNRQTMLRQF